MKKKKTALVTGANKGIGHETARRLAELDLTVLMGARDQGRGEAAVDGLRNNSRDVQLLILDVADEQSIARAAASVAERFGRLDILVNNAGISLGAGLPSNQGLEAMRSIFATNVFGPIAVAQAFLPLLERAPAARIVNVSSSLGSLGLAADPESPSAQLGRLFGYAASKTALNAFTLWLANELRSKHVKVNAACPGYVATDLNRHKGPRTVEQGAEIIVRLATLPDDGPTGGFFDDAGSVPW
ncbi:MAG TPA: SDR family oxidoreductase [Polyangiaceae bacterium]|nr:SDR family oxidoreductase [Polyangiaceae bacterium]